MLRLLFARNLSISTRPKRTCDPFLSFLLTPNQSINPTRLMASQASTALANTSRGTETSHFSNESLRASKLFDVSGLKAVVTGGGSGIGLMIAQALQTNGATVYITGRRKEALDAVVEQYSTGPGKLVALPGDITKKEECLRLADELEKAEPDGIHALVNNAGTTLLGYDKRTQANMGRHRSGRQDKVLGQWDSRPHRCSSRLGASITLRPICMGRNIRDECHRTILHVRCFHPFASNCYQIDPGLLR